MKRKLANLPTTEEILAKMRNSILSVESKLPKNILFAFNEKDTKTLTG